MLNTSLNSYNLFYNNEDLLLLENLQYYSNKIKELRDCIKNINSKLRNQKSLNKNKNIRNYLGDNIEKQFSNKFNGNRNKRKYEV